MSWLERRFSSFPKEFEMARPPEAGTWGFASSPAVGRSGVYVGGLDGRVYGFAL